MPKLKVPREFVGQRIDVVLSKLEPSMTRNSWQKLIKDGRISVNDELVKSPSLKTPTGNISFTLPQSTQPPVDAVDTLYEDTQVIVLNKPPGILTHAKGTLHTEWTLADYIAKKTEDTGNRPGIIHRLDRDTSGVIIVAKTNKAKQQIQTQFANRTVKKHYVAILEGVVANNKARFEWPIGRNPKKPSRFYVDSNGKPAVSILRVKQRFAASTFVDVEPLTGRTHQIRVHMAHFGHPISGDRFYGTVNTKHRLWLHAKTLELTLNSKRRIFKADLPDDFKAELKRLDV
jgi:23S rRNA pseudouridine1911/1915/1917 synthase